MSVQNAMHEFINKYNGLQTPFCKKKKKKGLNTSKIWRLAQTLVCTENPIKHLVFFILYPKVFLLINNKHDN